MARVAIFRSTARRAGEPLGSSSILESLREAQNTNQRAPGEWAGQATPRCLTLRGVGRLAERERPGAAVRAHQCITRSLSVRSTHPPRARSASPAHSPTTGVGLPGVGRGGKMEGCGAVRREAGGGGAGSPHRRHIAARGVQSLSLTLRVVSHTRAGRVAGSKGGDVDGNTREASKRAIRAVAIGRASGTAVTARA
ncbi:MAG TPA: hypothetical protein VKV19_13085 [Ktedonobacteraceae bacterium]|nr:hypothetical protein [Ktedonobacteraceae bacterium]